MHSKITPEHLDRGAVVYVRQSTMGQVAEHTKASGGNMRWPSRRAHSDSPRSR